jgi:hypothetical protein
MVGLSKTGPGRTRDDARLHAMEGEDSRLSESLRPESAKPHLKTELSMAQIPCPARRAFHFADAFSGSTQPKSRTPQ